MLKANAFAKQRVMRTGLVILVMVLLSGLVFALNDARGSEAEPGSGSKIDYPNGSKDVVVRIEYQGGFRLPTASATQRPIFTLYGDGCYIVEGPMIAIFPPPALPNLQQGCLTEEGVQHILRLAQDAGLLNEGTDTGILPDSDELTTVFTVTANGKTVVTKAYALGNEAAFSLMPEQVAAREKLIEFMGAVNAIPENLVKSAEIAYDFDRLQVVVLPAELAGVTEGLEPQTIAWPLSQNLAAFGDAFDRVPGATCGIVEGADLDILKASLEGANTETRWTSGGSEYVLYVNPLLPDGTGC